MSTFTITIIDTATLNINLTQTTNSTYSNVKDIIFSTAFLASLMEQSIKHRIRIVKPTDNDAINFSSYTSYALANASSSISTYTDNGNFYIGTINNPLIRNTNTTPTTYNLKIGEVTQKIGVKSLNWGFFLEYYDTTISNWQPISQDPGNYTYTILINNINYLIDVAFSASLSIPLIERKTASPSSITIGEITYSTTINNTITNDYRLTLPEQRTIDNPLANDTNVDDQINLIIPNVNPIDIIATNKITNGSSPITGTKVFRDTNQLFPTLVNWNTAKIYNLKFQNEPLIDLSSITPSSTIQDNIGYAVSSSNGFIQLEIDTFLTTKSKIMEQLNIVSA